jgi:hypothetical protein
MVEARGLQIGVKDGKKEILNETSDAFAWFPELERLFENCQVKTVLLDVEKPLLHFDKVYFKIEKKS